ncbi:hypothetical protein [Cognatishimia sp. MH4019]|uniref:hypothetical protein n=1 Tax=Cognatishimia sp. MH4019 TaxID=2854030 RepID=UPI001CD6368E|nr:hypothetical protein [Cognatishimia sp. MH4019]
MTLRLAGQSDSVGVALDTGHICDLRLNGLAPLHRAPWLDEPAVQSDETIPLVERRLQGDFFCAPFGKSDLIEAPIHGLTANSAWEVVRHSATEVVMRLSKTVMGAQVDKRVALNGGALVQTHRIVGGNGALPVAHHPMIHMDDGGRLSFSPKAAAMTPDAPLEAGRNWLNYPAQGKDLHHFPGATGPVDLTRYPTQAANEDFITLIEAPGAAFGWTAIARRAERDLIVIVKDPRCLPVTMLWYSNGGRDYAPWNGRHRGVLGVEDGCTAGAAGHRAASTDNAISAHGVPTALSLAAGRVHETRHAIYAVSLTETEARVERVFVRNTHLVALLKSGSEVPLGTATKWMRKV